MAVQNFCGDAFRGATWVALHNGDGTGWGEAINGGFGLVLDGSGDAERRARMMLGWDVSNGSYPYLIFMYPRFLIQEWHEGRGHVTPTQNSQSNALCYKIQIW